MASQEESTAPSNLYDQDDLLHESDFEAPLHHGTIRYVPAPYLSLQLKSELPVKNDRNYVYVPPGYINRNKDNFLKKIMDALGLDFPNLVLVIAATEGSREEQKSKFAVDDETAKSAPLSNSELKQVLHFKVEEMLTSCVNCCFEMGAWIMPEDPRRRNGAAQMICSAIKKSQVGTPIAFGLFGLDDRDEADGFKESLKAGMEPVGSPIKKVSKVMFDPDIKDGAPCSQLTHMLIFESPHEMENFKSALLAIVPDMLLAFGNITNDAMQTVYDYADVGNPIVMLKHTGNQVDKLCRMFEHVQKEMEKMTPEDSSTYAGRGLDSHNTLKIPPMIGIDDELINRFVSTWPADFKSESVLLCDPINMNGARFQQLVLRSITASFDLQQGDSDLQRERKKILDYAWSFHDITTRHALQKKRSAVNLHVQLIICTLLSIAASVLYDQIYGPGHGPNKGPIQVICFVMTILLPLYITSLKRETEGNNPSVRWSAFQVAAAKIESEIFKIRAQVGPYRPLEKTPHEMRKPLNALAIKNRAIWSTIKQYLADDGMQIPDSFWDMSSPVEMNEQDEGAFYPHSTSIDTVKRLSVFDTGAYQRTNKSIPGDEEAPIFDETTPMIKSGDRNYVHSKGLDKPFQDDINSTISMHTMSSQKPHKDDCYSPLSAERYLDIRMKKQMRIKSEELAKMTTQYQQINKTIQAITIFSGATAALSLQWMVPIILGATALFGSHQDFNQYNSRIQLANSMIVQLNELKLWWMGLSMYQRQIPCNKGRLILESEKIIISEVTAVHRVALADREPDESNNN